MTLDERDPRIPVQRTSPEASLGGQRIRIGGCAVDLLTRAEAVATIAARWGTQRVPLGVVSLNLDHIHHFGDRGAWNGIIEDPPGPSSVSWLHLLDGQPVVHRAQQLTGEHWPRLAGSDIIGDLLDEAEFVGARVGFLGGSADTQGLLRERLAATRPRLAVSGCWAPSRDDLHDHRQNLSLAADVAAAGTDVLVVGLGKPRQELWIAEYGAATGARTLLAFGAVVDFLAGRVSRAPTWMSEHTLEWAYRLALEPRRLGRRYIVQGPPAYLQIRQSTVTVPHPRKPPTIEQSTIQRAVCVAIVTYQSAQTIGPLLADLEREAATGTRLRVIVKDNGSTDGTLDIVACHPLVELVADRTNIGYAGAINAVAAHHGHSAGWDWLVLNADVRLREGALAAMLTRLHKPGVGAVVPLVLDDEGRRSPSLRRDPSAAGCVATALVGARAAGRLSETIHDPASYQYPHPVDWATGAVVLVRGAAAAEVGPWDERFFLYSEETDYFLRLRTAGWRVWFEPRAIVEHAGQGSGSSPRLDALMAINRVRFAEKHLPPRSAGVVRAATVFWSLTRSHRPGARAALRHLVSRASWDGLPSAPRPGKRVDSPPGSVVVPAHNEESVLARTLEGLAPLIADGTEVVVAANGCTDDTARVASQFTGVRVLDLPQPGKIGALNAADAVLTKWPRLYLDADIEISAEAVRDVFRALADESGPMAARPAVRTDTTGASWLVRRHYAAKARAVAPGPALWGAGAYALSERGRARFDAFPDVVADDLFVTTLFSSDEVIVVDTDPVVVRTPRSVAGLLAISRRSALGNAELRAGHDALDTTRDTARALAKSIVGPVSLVDAVVYASITLLGRWRAGLPGESWDRDNSSR